MKTNRAYIEALATGLAEQTGITFTEGQGFSTDVTKNQITYDVNELSQLTSIEAKGMMIHEVGHVKHTKDTPVTELQKEHPEAMQNLYNSFEDMRVNERMRVELGDFAKQALEQTNAYAARRIRELTKNPKFQEASSPLMRVMSALLFQEASERAWSGMGRGWANSGVNALYHSMSDEERHIFTELKKKNTHIKARNATSIDAVKTLVDSEVYPLMKDLLDTQEKESKASGGGKKPLDEKLNPSHMSEDEEHSHKQAEQPLEFEYEAMTHKEVQKLVSPWVRVLTHKLGDILKEKSLTKFDSGYPMGKLRNKHAYKVATGQADIFSKRLTPREPNYVVTIVLDESGSMEEDNRKHHTYIASVLLEDICRNLGFKTNVIIYNDNVRRVESVEAYREFRSGGNADAKAMRAVLKITDKKNENLVFVLTDGGVCDDPRAELKEMRENGYTVVSIGVGLPPEELEMLREFYEDTIEAQEMEQLPEIIIRTLKRLIKR